MPKNTPVFWGIFCQKGVNFPPIWDPLWQFWKPPTSRAYGTPKWQKGTEKVDFGQSKRRFSCIFRPQITSPKKLRTFLFLSKSETSKVNNWNHVYGMVWQIWPIHTHRIIWRDTRARNHLRGGNRTPKCQKRPQKWQNPLTFGVFPKGGIRGIWRFWAKQEIFKKFSKWWDLQGKPENKVSKTCKKWIWGGLFTDIWNQETNKNWKLKSKNKGFWTKIDFYKK